MANLGGSSARKYAKRFEKACNDSEFCEPVAASSGGVRDAILPAAAPPQARECRAKACAAASRARGQIARRAVLTDNFYKLRNL